MDAPIIHVRLPAELRVEDIVDSLSSEDLIKFITLLDEHAADWDVTLQLCDYFDAQRKAYEAECEAETARSMAAAAAHLEAE